MKTTRQQSMLATLLLICAGGCGKPVGTAPQADAGPDAKGAQESTSQAPGLTLDRLYEDPPLDGVSIRSARWTKDGSKVGYLRPGRENRDVLELWVWEVATGKSRRLLRAQDVVSPEKMQLTEEEILALERRRITQRGITSFVWAPGGDAVLVPLGGSLYLTDLSSGDVKRLLDGGDGTALDPRFSPDGSRVVFVRDGDLFMVQAEDGAVSQLTTGATDTVTRGLAEFVAQEEMGRYRGYWWSPDSTRIAFLEVDETAVEVWKRASYHAGESTMAEQRYPGAGRTNATVRPGVVDVKTGKVEWIELPDWTEYVPRVDFRPDGQALTLQIQPRDQKKLALLEVDMETGQTRVLVTDRMDTFVNLHDDVTFLEDGRFLWTDESTGVRQIFLHDASGKRLAQLTRGELPVVAVEGVDEETKAVLYSAVTNRSLELHLFSVPLGGGDPVQITTDPGWHSVTVSDDAKHFVDTHSTAVSPPRSTVHDASGKLLSVLEDNPTEELDRLLTTKPAFFTVKAADGETDLNAMFIKPPDFQPKNPYPVVVYGYGGPHGHVVQDRWRRSGLFSHFLAQQGYVVFSVDPRGSNFRGKAFEDQIYKRCGVLEVQDHQAAVQHIATLPFVDSQRIGIWGWSYGGYLTIMSLLATDGLYRAGIAVAPVTDWKWYDTHYTERYMGMPDADADVYAAGSALEQDPSGLTEDLLVVHGMADDNVFLRHTLSFIEKLQSAPVQFDLMLYPGKTHLIAGKNTRKHLFTMMFDYWQTHLR